MHERVKGASSRARLPGTRHNKLAQRAIKHPFLAIFRVLGELFRACAHIRPSRAKYFVYRTQKHGDVETNDTTAHPQQGTYETGITTAPTNCTKNAHFLPAKAMAVPIPHRHQRAKATMVSDHRAAGPTGPGRGTRGPFHPHVGPMTCAWATNSAR